MGDEATNKVSVIIPVLNEERFIKTFLESLISQTYPLESMEWIFIDGGSTDSTAEIIIGFSDKYPITLIRSKKGTPHQLNVGVEKSSGKYIIRLDAHTRYPRNYIERCVYYLDTVDADNVGGLVETVAEGRTGQAIANVLSSKFGVGESQFRVNGTSGYVDTVPFGAFRRDVFDRIGLFNEELIRSEDNDFNARIRESGGKVYLADDIVSEYYCRDTVSGMIRYAMQNGNALFHTFRANPKAMSLRHFIPFLFMMSLLTLPLLSLFYPFFRYVFAAEMTVYLLLDIFFSFSSGEYGIKLLTILLFPLFHISYGIGSLLGLVGVRLY